MASTFTSSSNTDAQQTKEDIKPWIRRLARFGFMAKGTVYMLIGLLTFMAVIGVGGGKTTGTSGMFRTVAQVAFGEILLWGVAIGLLGYIIWRLIEAVLDPANKGSDAKGIITRIGYVVAAVIYGGIAYNAVKIAVNAGSSGGSTEKTMSAQLLSQPFGQWLVGTIGIITIGYAVYEFYQGSTGRFMKSFNHGDMDKHRRKVAETSGRFGLSARGVVLGLIGFFFIRTAVTSNPDQAKGMDGALSEISQQPFGQVLLGIAGLGLMLYGIYQIVRGRYTRMNFGAK
ncbi:DUF1206 domain-containing protein [Halobacillus kuroshimensis]|uniref:DUF1206 domain-containing protein n=1 Tax=Halobacillus kuroshimensis TaxID=302481 RepID=A0ABS3DX40_9BACI|nr:DUF1206 domain-containing protein [Halobacillus kuroshimensis]MBN8235887.1 DUF1206 domain-containing protein [Halobacillus kuroshimensis]